MPDFLLEIGCEEIPARMIEEGAVALWQHVRTRLELLRLLPSVSDPAGYGTIFSTPRRLAVLFPDIRKRQADSKETIIGPSLKVAFKDGNPAAPALAFAKKVGLDLPNLKTVSTSKGDYLAAEVTKEGRAASDSLAEMLPSDIASIPWAKTMYWASKNERFVRPVRWIVALLDEQVIPLEFDGIAAGNTSRGHRVLADRPVQIARAGQAYVEALAQAKVLGRAEREKQIRKALDAATRTVPGARWREDKALLETVVNLTEFPSVILGNFDPQFLELPEEVLVTVMRDHQKYFAVEDAEGKLAPHFLAVLNTDADRAGIIQHGNERVLRARFNDARFFWQTDQKQSLRDRVELLKHVTFQKDLGNYYEKAIRVQRLASWLSEIVRQGGLKIRPGVVHKAALLAKTDLTTELVKEFTELQGVVGGLYARVQVLDEHLPEEAQQEIAKAIYDHYKPESMEDSVPRSIEGAVLSVADKADSIAGMFALGLIPSGSKDPFGLRRQANGIVKTIAEHKLPFRLGELMRDARARYEGAEAEKKFSADAKFAENTSNFFRERVEFYLRDARGFAYDVVNAVLAAGWEDVVDAVARADAVTRVRPSADFESISVAFKRMKNILRQAEQAGKRPADALDASGLKEDAERELAVQIPRVAERVEVLRSSRDYEPALLEIARLRPLVDQFFDKVMVMVDDERLRANRLALLRTLVREFSTIADFSEIVTEGKESPKQ
jgi:glycyl-tRNA synthetase beta chain